MKITEKLRRKLRKKEYFCSLKSKKRKKTQAKVFSKH